VAGLSSVLSLQRLTLAWHSRPKHRESFPLLSEDRAEVIPSGMEPSGPWTARLGLPSKLQAYWSESREASAPVVNLSGAKRSILR
jgi:hypothetical protein